MADVKISGLPASTVPLAGTEVLPIVQSGVTKKVAVSDLTAGRAISTTVLTSTVAIGTAPFVVTSTTNVANLNASSHNGATFASPGAIGGTTASAITGTTITGTDTTEATSTTAAALKTAGGLAVAKKIYAGDNIVVVSGKGIDFSATAGTGTSELLADYEEGTWTPVLTLNTPGDSAVTYTGQYGNYVKIGKQVTVTGFIAVATWSTGTGSGGPIITGLPYTVGTNIYNISANLELSAPVSTGYQATIRATYNAATLDLLRINGNVSPTTVSALDNPANGAAYIFTVTYFV
jgi:hypothetical protein